MAATVYHACGGRYLHCNSPPGTCARCGGAAAHDAGAATGHVHFESEAGAATRELHSCTGSWGIRTRRPTDDCVYDGDGGCFHGGDCRVDCNRGCCAATRESPGDAGVAKAPRRHRDHERRNPCALGKYDNNRKLVEEVNRLERQLDAKERSRRGHRERAKAWQRQFEAASSELAAAKSEVSRLTAHAEGIRAGEARAGAASGLGGAEWATHSRRAMASLQAQLDDCKVECEQLRAAAAAGEAQLAASKAEVEAAKGRTASAVAAAVAREREAARRQEAELESKWLAKEAAWANREAGLRAEVESSRGELDAAQLKLSRLLDEQREWDACSRKQQHMVDELTAQLASRPAQPEPDHSETERLRRCAEEADARAERAEHDLRQRAEQAHAEVAQLQYALRVLKAGEAAARKSLEQRLAEAERQCSITEESRLDVMSKLDEASEVAAKEANTLKARIAELEQQLAAAHKSCADAQAALREQGETAIAQAAQLSDEVLGLSFMGTEVGAAAEGARADADAAQALAGNLQQEVERLRAELAEASQAREQQEKELLDLEARWSEKMEAAARRDELRTLKAAEAAAQRARQEVEAEWQSKAAAWATEKREFAIKEAKWEAQQARWETEREAIADDLEAVQHELTVSGLSSVHSPAVTATPVGGTASKQGSALVISARSAGRATRELMRLVQFPSERGDTDDAIARARREGVEIGYARAEEEWRARSEAVLDDVSRLRASWSAAAKRTARFIASEKERHSMAVEDLRVRLAAAEATAATSTREKQELRARFERVCSELTDASESADAARETSVCRVREAEMRAEDFAARAEHLRSRVTKLQDELRRQRRQHAVELAVESARVAMAQRDADVGIARVAADAALAATAMTIAVQKPVLSESSLMAQERQQLRLCSPPRTAHEGQSPGKTRCEVPGESTPKLREVEVNTPRKGVASTVKGKKRAALQETDVATTQRKRLGSRGRTRRAEFVSPEGGGTPTMPLSARSRTARASTDLRSPVATMR